jgi:hypothetical protein
MVTGSLCKQPRVPQAAASIRPKGFQQVSWSPQQGPVPKHIERTWKLEILDRRCAATTRSGAGLGVAPDAQLCVPAIEFWSHNACL